MPARPVSLLALLLLAACGGGEPPPPSRPVTPIDPASTGTIRSEVRFDGTPPPAREVRMNSECAALQTGPVTIVDVAVTNGHLANAFVWISSGLGDRGFALPTTAVTIDQHGCLYTPRVVGVRVGQDIQFINSDAFLHNVHGTPKTQRGWNFGMGLKGATRTIRLDRAEVPVSVRCDVHPWMQAWVGVVDHPYFGVTGPDGAVALPNVPAGDYGLTAWHEKLGTREAKVHVAAQGTAEATFTFTAPGVTQN